MFFWKKNVEQTRKKKIMFLIATFPQLKKVTPTEAILTKIQGNYLSNTFPEVLHDIAMNLVQ